MVLVTRSHGSDAGAPQPSRPLLFHDAPPPPPPCLQNASAAMPLGSGADTEVTPLQEAARPGAPFRLHLLLNVCFREPLHIPQDPLQLPGGIWLDVIDVFFTSIHDVSAGQRQAWPPFCYHRHPERHQPSLRCLCPRSHVWGQKQIPSVLAVYQGLFRVQAGWCQRSLLTIQPRARDPLSRVLLSQFFLGRKLKWKELRKCGGHWVVDRWSRSPSLLCTGK